MCLQLVYVFFFFMFILSHISPLNGIISFADHINVPAPRSAVIERMVVTFAEYVWHFSFFVLFSWEAGRMVILYSPHNKRDHVIIEKAK